jgi:hypothetical protein
VRAAALTAKIPMAQGTPEAHLRSEKYPRYLSECLKKWLILPMHIAALPTLFFIVNLLPVTIGNIIGGSLMAVMVYWFVYTRKGMVTPATSDAEDQA